MGQSAKVILDVAEGVAAFADDDEELRVMVKGVVLVLAGPGGSEGEDGVLLLAGPLAAVETAAVGIERIEHGGDGFDEGIHEPGAGWPGIVSAQSATAVKGGGEQEGIGECHESFEHGR